MLSLLPKPKECESYCFSERRFLIRPMSRFGRDSDDLQREVTLGTWLGLGRDDIAAIDSFNRQLHQLQR
jgi:hypothetical protein